MKIALQLCLFGVIAASILSCLGAPVMEYDEVIPWVHGTLVQQGQTPHLQFPYFYPPLGLYLNAASFAILGRNVVAARAINILLYIAVLVLANRLMSLRFAESKAIIPAALMVLATSMGTALNLAVLPGFATSFTALLVYLCYISDQKHPRYLLAGAGIVTGVAFLYRVNFGSYVAAVIVVDLLLKWYFTDRKEGERREIKQVARDFVTYAGALGLFVLAVCLILYGKDVVRAFSEFTIEPLHIMLRRGFLPLTFDRPLIGALTLPFGWFAFRILEGDRELSPLPLTAAAFSIVLVASAAITRNNPQASVILVTLQFVLVVFLHVFVHRLERSEFCTLLFSCFVSHYYISRADWFHWRVLPIIQTLLFLFLILAEAEKTKKTESSISNGSKLARLLFVFYLILVPIDPRFSKDQILNGAGVITAFSAAPWLSDSDRLLGPGRKAWTAVYPSSDEWETLKYLRGRTGASEPIFVGVQDHARVFTNNVRLYWLADRPIGTRMILLEMMIASEPAVQGTIISDLERNGVNWIVIDCEQEPLDKTLIEANHKGSTLLDEYIGSHFREDARFGQYAVLTRAGPLATVAR